MADIKFVEKGFDHPCKQTCSGWKQGHERGHAEGMALGLAKAARDLGALVEIFKSQGQNPNWVECLKLAEEWKHDGEESNRGS